MTAVYHITLGQLHAASLLLGVSDKNNTDSIGRFGTGLKYAIAGILRLGGKISIRHANGTQETFTTVPVPARSKTFQAVHSSIHGSLGFTTEMGKHWQPWMLYRELESNTIDEDGKTLETSTWKLGFTEIEVICEAYAQAKKDFQHTIFLCHSPFSVLFNDDAKGVKIFHPIPKLAYPNFKPEEKIVEVLSPVNPDFTDVAPRAERTTPFGLGPIYHRGVFIGTHNRWQLPFPIELNSAHVSLSEDRQISWLSVYVTLFPFLQTQELFNHVCDFMDYWGLKIHISSEECRSVAATWPESVKEMVGWAREYESTGKLVPSAVTMLIAEYRNKNGGFTETIFEEREANQLIEAEIAIVRRYIPWPGRPKFTSDMTDREMGCVVLRRGEDPEMWINAELVKLRSPELRPTLIEEFIHAHHGANDFSRDFQEVCVKVISQLMEDMK